MILACVLPSPPVALDAISPCAPRISCADDLRICAHRLMRRLTVCKLDGSCSTASCWCSAAASPAAARRRQPGGLCGASAQRRRPSPRTDPRWIWTPSAGLRTRSRSLLTQRHARASGVARRMTGAVASMPRCNWAAVQQQPSSLQTWTLPSTRCLQRWLRHCLLLRRSSSLCQCRQAARLHSSRFPSAPAARQQPGLSCQPSACMPPRSRPEPPARPCSPSTRRMWRSCCGGTKQRRDR